MSKIKIKFRTHEGSLKSTGGVKSAVEIIDSDVKSIKSMNHGATLGLRYETINPRYRHYIWDYFVVAHTSDTVSWRGQRKQKNLLKAIQMYDPDVEEEPPIKDYLGKKLVIKYEHRGKFTDVSEYQDFFTLDDDRHDATIVAVNEISEGQNEHGGPYHFELMFETQIGQAVNFTFSQEGPSYLPEIARDFFGENVWYLLCAAGMMDNGESELRHKDIYALEGKQISIETNKNKIVRFYRPTKE